MSGANSVVRTDTFANNSHERRLIGALLRVPFLIIVGRVHKGLLAAGFDDLSPAHMVVFQHIRAEGSRLTDLADQARMTKQSMGYLVDYLEERSYLERTQDPADGRARLIKLRQSGWEVERVAADVVRGIEAEWAHLIGPEQMKSLITLLQNLVLALGESIDTYLPENV